MKSKLEDLGCVVWVVGVIAVAILGGWFAHKAFVALVWMPLWESIVLGILAGIVALIILLAISSFILVVTGKLDQEWPPDYEEPYI